MSRVFMLVAGLAVVAVLVVTNLGGQAGGNPTGLAQPSPVNPGGQTNPDSAPAGATDLMALREAAGIPDCPELNDAGSVAGGMPDITLNCLGSDRQVRLSDLRGPMLVNLWAQWCPPCRAESPDLAAFAAKQDRVAVLGINYSDPEPVLAIQFAQQMQMKYPQLVDARAELRGPLAVSGIPQSYLIDVQGKVVAVSPGMFRSLEQIEAWVQENLG